MFKAINCWIYIVKVTSTIWYLNEKQKWMHRVNQSALLRRLTNYFIIIKIYVITNLLNNEEYSFFHDKFYSSINKCKFWLQNGEYRGRRRFLINCTVRRSFLGRACCVLFMSGIYNNSPKSNYPKRTTLSKKYTASDHAGTGKYYFRYFYDKPPYSLVSFKTVLTF